MQTATSAVPVSPFSEHGADVGTLAQGQIQQPTVLTRTPRLPSSYFRAFLGVLWVFLLAPLASYAQTTYPFDLPAQPLAESLRAVGHQTSTNVMFEPRLVKGLTAPALRMEATTAEAIRLLLAGTKLTALQAAADTILIQRASKAEASAPTSQAVAQTSPTSGTNGYTHLVQAGTASPQSSSSFSSAVSTGIQKEALALEEIVVIGTNIRGVYPSSSPVQIYTAEDIARTGATTTEQFIQRLPQNLGTRNQFSAGSTQSSGAFVGRESVSGVDLRGLGVGTTLTLLNGRRLALASNGQAADISLVPVSALKRVEVLTDGASAIYGSDAIGGVVNFVLRDDFEGAQTKLSYGSVTSGGLHQVNATQTFGRGWGSGNGLISYDFFTADPLQTSDRNFAAPSGPGWLTPDDRRHSVLATVSQELGARVTINGDFAYSTRAVENFFSNLTSTSSSSNFTGSFDSDTEQYFANLGADIAVSETLRGSLLASYSQVDVDSLSVITAFNRTPPFVSTSNQDTSYSGLDLTAKLDGSLLRLPAGSLRYSVGAGRMNEDYTSARTISGTVSGKNLGRVTTYAFGELFAPLAGAAQGIPLLERLELSIAARYTKYEDDSSPALGREFGDKVSPKVGLLWSPVASLAFRGSYGRSFRAPTLTEVDPSEVQNTLREPFVIGNQPATVLIVSGPALDLGPETAETYTLGFDYRSSSAFRLSGTYFNIDYVDRIAAPSNVPARANPAAWPDIVFRASSAAQIEEFLRTTPNVLNQTSISLTDLHQASLELFALPNFWINRGGLRNLALTEVDGFDLHAGYDLNTSWGRLTFGGQMTKVLSFLEQSTPTAPVITVVDTVLRPVDLRGRVYCGARRGEFVGTLGINYVDDYSSPLAPVGRQRITSWTTVDLHVAYDLGAQWTFMQGVKLGLSVQNLFDRDPPYVGDVVSGIGLVNPQGFDPANANPLGRFAALQIEKTW